MALCVGGGLFLVAAASPWMEHPTFHYVYKMSTVFMLLSLPLSLAFMSAIGCPNPHCGRSVYTADPVTPPSASPQEKSWFREYIHDPDEHRRLRNEQMNQAMVGFDNLLYTVFTRDRYECPKCKTVLREGPRTHWSIVKIVAAACFVFYCLKRLYELAVQSGFLETW